MKLIPDWRKKVVSVATARLGWALGTAGTIWTMLSPEDQAAIVGRMGLDGIGAVIAVTGIGVVAARVVAFKDDDAKEHNAP